MKKLSLLLILSSIFIVSCKKEGCTDVDAINYDSDVNTNDGSCEYQTDVSFWFDQGTSDQLTNWYSVTELNVYINNSSVGSINASDWSTGPDCGGANFTATWDMGNKTSMEFNYAANDQTGNQQFYGTDTFMPNECKSIELVW